MPAANDPFAVLGVSRDASDAEIHAAYREAVRRTHPDAGGSASAFQAVQAAYEQLRDPAARARADSRSAPPPPHRAAEPIDHDAARARMEDLLAESRRLEDEARRLAGLPPLYEEDERAGPPEQQDSFAAILRDAGTQLRELADEGGRELRRFIRRHL